MSLLTLVIYIGIAALVLTALVWKFGESKNYLISFLQNFCGALFIFSGWVKAIDPLGTAYKMEQYFAEFEATFEATWISFIAPLFPALSSLSIQFSVFMIVLEIVLGVMLLLGARPKFTAWAFFIIIVFFTILTGFTYLTGFVPSSANFFQFSQWTSFQETNMKVTDCGCFGDFIKLKPKTSFFKDIFLLIPSVLFILMYGKKHQWFSKKARDIITIAVTVLLLFYCFKNYVWNLPHIDFRPFAVTENIREKKLAEEEASANVEVIAYDLENKQTGEVMRVDYDEYINNYNKYKDSWSALNQIKTEPAIASTKVSEFDVSDQGGSSVTDDILNEPGYSFMVIAHKLKDDGSVMREVSVQDSIFKIDTVQVEETEEILLVKSLDRIDTRVEKVEDYLWKADYLRCYLDGINPILHPGLKDGHKAYLITSYASEDILEDFAKDIDAKYPIYVADDILLKTIIRSNPGLVLMKDGKILDKWHIKKVPAYEDIKSMYLK